MAAPDAPPAAAVSRTARPADLTGVAGDLYANSFAASEPRAMHSLLTGRLKRAEQFNEDLAEYFKQRNLIEDTYVKALLRLSKRPISQVGSSNLPGEELGDVTTRIRDLLERELTEIASSHTVYQRRLLQEVEMPLREAASKGEWSRTRTYDTNLLSTIKELEEAEQRHAKSKGKLDSASAKKQGQLQQKAGEDSRHLSIVRETYLTESPFAFQHYQTVDQERLAFLNETVARFETVQSDHARELMEIAERGMVQVLASDPREEMQEFAVKYGNANAALGLEGSSRQRARGGSRTNGVSASARDAELMPPPPVPTITAPGGQLSPSIQRQASIRSSSRQSQSDTPSIRSGGGGLKNRFTGLLSRSNRNSQLPPSFQPPSDPPPGSVGDENLGDQSFSTIQAPSTIGGDEEFGAGADRLGPSITPTQAPSGSVNKRSSFLPGMLSRRKTSKSAPTQPPADVRVKPEPTPPTLDSLLGGTTSRRGTAGFEMSQRDALNAISEDRARDAPLPPMPTFGGAAAPAAAGAAAVGAATALASSGTQVDADGFTVPPANRDRAPWETGQGTTSLLDDDEGQTTGGAGPVSPFAIQPVAQPTMASTAEQDAALQRVKSTLLSSAQAPSRRSTGARGRRDRMSTLSPAIPDDMPLGQAVQQRSISPPASATSDPSSPFGTASVASASSPRAAAMNPFANAASLSSGVRASITETVNVLIKGGAIQRTMVTGEVSFLFKDVSPSGATPLRFRINGAERFEKVAANKALVEEHPGGEYTIRPSATSAQEAGQVVLKYQLESNANAAAFVPLELTPQWRNEANQTSMLLTYNVNPSCSLLSPSVDSPFDEPAVLEGVTFSAALTVPVGNIQSRPEGKWDAAEKKMTWPIEDPAAPGKILARFSHEAEGTNVPSPVSVKWLVKGKNVSGVGVEVVGGADGPRFEDVARATVSGRYLAA